MATTDRLSELVAARDYAALVSECEALELTLATRGSNENPPYTIQMLAYLVLHDLPSARYLWKRIPAALKESKDLEAAWNIGRAMWEKQFGAAFAAMRARSWAPLLEAMVAHVHESYRTRVLHLVSRAYTHIRAQDLVSFLGLEPEGLGDVLASLDWTLDGDVVTPRPLERPAVAIASLASLSSLTQYSIYMETQSPQIREPLTKLVAELPRSMEVCSTLD